MKKAWKIFRTFVLTLVFVLIALPVSLYLILSTDWAQNDIRCIAVNELSALLGTEITLGKIEIHPFNKLSIYDVEALDDNGDSALKIDEISVAFELFHLLRTGKLVIDYALIRDPYLNLYKTTASSPLNIAGIIDALKSDKPNRPQSRYDLTVNSVVMVNGSLKFDILDTSTTPNKFDKNHIRLSDVCLNAYIPRISNEEYRVEIDRFSFREQNGFRLSDLKAAAKISLEGSELEYLTLIFPHSEVALSPIVLNNSGFTDITELLRKDGLNLHIKPGSVIYPPDFASFCPQLSNLRDSVELIIDGSYSEEKIKVDKLVLSESSANYIATLTGNIDRIYSGVNATYSVDDLRISANTEGLKSLTAILPDNLKSQIEGTINKLKIGETFSSTIEAKGKISDSQVNVRLALADNALRLTGRCFSTDSFSTINFSTECNLAFTNLHSLFGSKFPSAIKSSIHADGFARNKYKKIRLKVDSASVDYLGHHYDPITLAIDINNNEYSLDFNIFDPDVTLSADFNAEVKGKDRFISGSLDIAEFNPSKLLLTDKYPGYRLNATLASNIEFSSLEDLSGYITVTDINFKDDVPATPNLHLNAMTIQASPNEETPELTLTSDIINAHIAGSYNLSTIFNDIKGITEMIMPAIKSNKSATVNTVKTLNDFNYRINISECENFCRFFNLPVSVIYPIDIDGQISSPNSLASLNLTAPYLLQGDKIIENTALTATINGLRDQARLSLTSQIPTKKGPLTATAELNGSSNRIDNSLLWKIDRKIPINGSFNFTTNLIRDFDNQLSTEISFHPGTITFGSDIWHINPSVISLAPNRYEIQRFAMTSDNKSISIDGLVSDDEDTGVNVSLSNIALLDIFETLEIDKALIGGTATGNFTGKALLSSQPEIYSDNLHVDSISYNRCVLGDADIKAKWDNEKKSFNLNADVIGQTGLHSKITGDIVPTEEALDITFDVQHVPVGFLKPFMEAFAADLNGYASGKARLFGTFKYIDLEGDVFADDLNIKIAFTNTWYSATDSIKIRPGVIDIDHITIRDINGNTAMLNGVVHHTFFKEPTFNFSITDAHNFLSYDVDSRISPDWYGTLYGNGGATISGEPGVVNIGVNMSTAPKSTFTFVLSDRLDADEYSFITFKDSRAEARRDSLLRADNVPTAVRLLRERLQTVDPGSSSAYNMDLQMDITPDARMALIMDPVSGDEIKANGAGNLRLTYESLNNDLKMYGTYTLNRGNYNFTLQDIIIKDFTIKEGSSIAFHGDPYSAQLNIEAIYAVNANLSDLDESFLLDKDLNRTNVPVHALLNVTGDMRQPDIDFDLEFPTLTQDTYRKVRSIVSTKDMMNRQIIYLLALNRFYTPDYMAATTKGNELFSVASSTISSQLSSMLGKLSDDWSIAPNLRSDRGDFSDVEVDVALSSRLLNNRLLFNGNFGYRDKTLNTNQFIGDFDIEYLLNPKGSWRLKAYNRYNDQNYYVRTAQTTQGVGLVFKKDFDNFFGFLRPKKKKLIANPKSEHPTKTIEIPDSIAHPLDPLLQQ